MKTLKILLTTLLLVFSGAFAEIPKKDFKIVQITTKTFSCKKNGECKVTIETTRKVTVNGKTGKETERQEFTGNSARRIINGIFER